MLDFQEEILDETDEYVNIHNRLDKRVPYFGEKDLFNDNTILI